MRGIQRRKNEANPSVAHWDINCWSFWATQNHGRRPTTPWFWVAQKLQQLISQCATDGFASFLKHWIPLASLHNIGYFMFYHIAELRRVFEAFNCIGQMEGLIFLSQGAISRSSFLTGQFLSVLIHWPKP